MLRKAEVAMQTTSGIPSRTTRAALAIPFGLSVLILANGCAQYGPRPDPISTEQVVSLSTQGAKPEVIITQIKESGTVYSLRAKDIKSLLDQGVDDRVVDYMLETRVRDVERQYRNYYYYPHPYPYYNIHWGYGFHCWP